MRQIDAEGIRIKPEFMHDVCGMAMIRVEDIVRILNEQPTIQPKRGKWKNIVDGIEYTWGTCDSCGARIPMPYKYYKYCPNCGADMIEVTI